LLAAACHIATTPTVGPVLGALTAIAVLAATTALLSVIAEPIFDLLVGRHWPDWPAIEWWKNKRVHHHESIRDRMGDKKTGPPSDARARYAHGGVAAAPTALGNRLLALSDLAKRRYGLELKLTWNPLVAVLEQQDHDHVEAQAAEVLQRTQTLIVFVASVIWAIQLPLGWNLAAIASIAAAVMIQYRRVEMALANYAKTVMLTLLLHRRLLYTALAAPVPPSTDLEVEYGKRLSEYLDGPGHEPFDYELK
jgi:hypothetical protein